VEFKEFPGLKSSESLFGIPEGVLFCVAERSPTLRSATESHLVGRGEAKRQGVAILILCAAPSSCEAKCSPFQGLSQESNGGWP
jgi:hypothetical protein